MTWRCCGPRRVTWGPDDWFVTGLIPLQTRLYRSIAGLVPVRADADDLFQKSLLTAWQERIRYDSSRDMFAWLCGIARNRDTPRDRLELPASGDFFSGKKILFFRCLKHTLFRLRLRVLL